MRVEQCRTRKKGFVQTKKQNKHTHTCSHQKVIHNQSPDGRESKECHILVHFIVSSVRTIAWRTGDFCPRIWWLLDIYLTLTSSFPPYSRTGAALRFALSDCFRMPDCASIIILRRRFKSSRCWWNRRKNGTCIKHRSVVHNRLNIYP